MKLTEKLRSPAFFFLLFSLAFGLFFVFLTAPLQAPDEHVHFFRAYQVSQGGLFAQIHEGKAGGWLPESVVELDRVFREPFAHISHKGVPASLIFDHLRLPLSPEKTVFQSFLGSANYPPVAYFPQAIGIAVGRVLGLPAIAILYLGRLSNLLVSVVLLYVVIRRARLYPWFLTVTSLLPMMLFQFGSLSADPFTYVLALFVISEVMSQFDAAVNEEAPLTVRWRVLFAGACALLALSKGGYLLLSGVALIVPQNRFAGFKQRAAFVGLTAAAVLISVGLWAYLNSDVYALNRNERAAVQVGFILSQPLEFLGSVFRSFGKFWSVYSEGWVGWLGWQDVRMPSWIRRSVPWLAIWIFLCESQGQPLPGWRDRLVLALAVSGTFALIFASQWIGWTPPGTPWVEGVQGRYFSPFLVLCLFTLAFHFRRKLRFLRFNPLWVAGFLFLVLETAVWRVWLRYFG